MNDWETIEKIVNTLPQWDVIKLIIGIQEELKCAKEDNLYQLRKNKDLQNRIDKAIEYIEKNSKQCLTNKIDEQPTKVIGKFMWHIDDLLDILKESGE
ncbi:MAG: hypothetical protein SPJ27_06705 [Candidatus Onthovivens sp.]|nr:hypothetical protein [Candidatus Onthovivens sp.]